MNRLSKRKLIIQDLISSARRYDDYRKQLRKENIKFKIIIDDNIQQFEKDLKMISESDKKKILEVLVFDTIFLDAGGNVWSTTDNALLNFIIYLIENLRQLGTNIQYQINKEDYRYELIFKDAFSKKRMTIDAKKHFENYFILKDLNPEKQIFERWYFRIVSSLEGHVTVHFGHPLLEVCAIHDRYRNSQFLFEEMCMDFFGQHSSYRHEVTQQKRRYEYTDPRILRRESVKGIFLQNVCKSPRLTVTIGRGYPKQLILQLLVKYFDEINPNAFKSSSFDARKLGGFCQKALLFRGKKFLEEFKKWLNTQLANIPNVVHHPSRNFAYKPTFGTLKAKEFVDFIWRKFYEYYEILRKPGECPFCYIQRKDISKLIKKALAYKAKDVLGKPIKYETVHVLLTGTGNIKGDASPRDVVNINTWHIQNNRVPPGQLLCKRCQSYRPGIYSLKEIYIDRYLNWCLKEAKCGILKSKKRTEIIKYLLQNDRWISLREVSQALKISKTEILKEITNPGKKDPKPVEMLIILFNQKEEKIKLNPKFKDLLKLLI